MATNSTLAEVTADDIVLIGHYRQYWIGDTVYKVKHCGLQCKLVPHMFIDGEFKNRSDYYPTYTVPNSRPCTVIKK